MNYEYCSDMSAGKVFHYQDSTAKTNYDLQLINYHAMKIHRNENEYSSFGYIKIQGFWFVSGPAMI